MFPPCNFQLGFQEIEKMLLSTIIKHHHCPSMHGCGCNVGWSLTHHITARLGFFTFRSYYPCLNETPKVGQSVYT